MATLPERQPLPCFGRARLVPQSALKELQLAWVLVACIPAKLTQQLIIDLGQQLPLQHLKHLKRVRKAAMQQAHMEVLVAGPEHGVCPVAFSSLAAGSPQPGGDGSPTGNWGNLPEAVASVTNAHQLQLYAVQVPAHAPQTRQQWELWGQLHWPMAWKAPDVGSSPLEGEQQWCSEQEQAYFQAQMSLLLSASPPPTEGNAARIVDSTTGEVVGQGTDQRLQHPLHHAALVAIQAASVRDHILWPEPTAGSHAAYAVAAAQPHAAAAAPSLLYGSQQTGSTCQGIGSHSRLQLYEGAADNVLEHSGNL